MLQVGLSSRLANERNHALSFTFTARGSCLHSRVLGQPTPPPMLRVLPGAIQGLLLGVIVNNT